jgi:sulfur carrier protein ThiS
MGGKDGAKGERGVKTVTVRLYGTLPSRFADYDRLHGMEVELPAEANLARLFRKIGIDPDQAVAAVEGKIVDLRKDEKLEDGALVRIFQVAHGG